MRAYYVEYVPKPVYGGYNIATVAIRSDGEIWGLWRVVVETKLEVPRMLVIEHAVFGAARPGRVYAMATPRRPEDRQDKAFAFLERLLAVENGVELVRGQVGHATTNTGVTSVDHIVHEWFYCDDCPPYVLVA